MGIIAWIVLGLPAWTAATSAAAVAGPGRHLVTGTCSGVGPRAGMAHR